MTLPASLDALRLRAQIASAVSAEGWASPTARTAGLAHVRSALDTYKTQAFALLDGDGGGAAASVLLAEGMRVCLKALFDSMALEDPAGAEKISLCAQGGFGAGQLAPHSDVDLLFIKPDQTNPETDPFLERYLYALWDLKIDIGGGACRTIDETLNLVREDASERTALLSLYHVAGDPAGTSRLARRFRRKIVEVDQTGFVEAKLKERDNRIERAGRSRFSVEPNIKSGKGGLRDLQLMRWLAQFLYGVDAFERWVGSRLLSVDDVDRYVKADDFLWTVRFHLHALAGGKDERLSFDYQPEIAARMGFVDDEMDSGVERFMRRYFQTAMHVGSLTRLVCAKLEADAWKAKPRGLIRFLPSRSEAGTTDLGDFVLRDGRLDFAGPTQISEDPVRLLSFFHIAASRGLDLHPEALARIGRMLHHVDDEFRSDPRAARAFFAVLLDSPAPLAVLRLMTEAGLLGRFVPEFGDVVGRTQFNMYHHYTVDEHTLQAIDLLRRIENGEFPDEHPLASQIVSEIKNRRALHLAILLHDTGKGAGDQCEEGGKRARVACARLGLDEAETELVAWLIENHLLMSDTAQRRDLGDPRTVADFSGVVGSLERLRLLALLTVVDIRAVGPGVWNGWKGQLMRELYAATEAALAASAVGVPDAAAVLRERAQTMRDGMRAGLERINPDFAAWWVEDMPDAYWLAFSEEDRFRHAAFVRKAREDGDDGSVAMRVDGRRAATEVMVWARDRERIFADLAAAIANAGADVVGANINTTRSGMVFDIFYIQDVTGQAFGAADTYLVDQLSDALRAVAGGAPPARRSRHLPEKGAGRCVQGDAERVYFKQSVGTGQCDRGVGP